MWCPWVAPDLESQADLLQLWVSQDTWAHDARLEGTQGTREGLWQSGTVAHCRAPHFLSCVSGEGVTGKKLLTASSRMEIRRGGGHKR